MALVTFKAQAISSYKTDNFSDFIEFSDGNSRNQMRPAYARFAITGNFD